MFIQYSHHACFPLPSILRIEIFNDPVCNKLYVYTDTYVTKFEYTVLQITSPIYSSPVSKSTFVSIDKSWALQKNHDAITYPNY
jgi:hypothetical protein